MSYTEDNEDLLGDVLNCSGSGDDEPLEKIEENQDEEGEQIPVPQVVEVKKRVVRNPQPKLNSQRLSGPRGVHTIEKYFEDFKFKGKRHEHTDLNRVMKRLEHWAHRLFPKFQFDDCIEKLERLGKQRVVMSYMNMYRQGNLQPEMNSEIVDNVENMDDDEVLAAPLDEIDELLDQQLAIARSSHKPNNDTIFDSLIQSPSSSRFGQSPVPCSTPYHTFDKPKETFPVLTEEQKERMALNRKKAQEKLLLKKKLEAEAAAKQNSETTMDDIELMID